MTEAAEILRKCPHVLLDFDGPMCAVFGHLSNHTVADKLRALLPGAIPTSITATNDPFEVLRYATTRSADIQEQVESELRRLEVAAVVDAPDTPGASETLHTFAKTGHTVSIVSNNSTSAVTTYLQAQELTECVDTISAREPARPLLLKPHPHLLQAAMTTLDTPPTSCVMVGDSVSDIQAAYRAGTAVIALANKPGKRERFEPHHPGVIIDDMWELGRAQD